MFDCVLSDLCSWRNLIVCAVEELAGLSIAFLSDPQITPAFEVCSGEVEF